MKVPIQFSLSYPNRYFDKIKPFNFIDNSRLTFESVDLQKFPCIRIAQEALSSGGSHQVVLNVANDQIVAKFLNKEISFVDIPKIIENCIDRHHAITEPTFNEIKEISLWTKEYLKKEFI